MSSFWIPPVACAWLVGVACQLQQAVLWPMWVYACGALVCGATGVVQLLRQAPWPAARRWGLWFVLGWGVAFSLTGARAVWVQASALDARWEGASVQVVGVVASMPQISDSGLRARFQVESAQPIVPIPLPEQIWLSWPKTHGTAEAGALPTLRAGDRWGVTVRLKAPHGHLNPHGGDQELWFWEHGLQAVGTVRQGYDVPGPRWLASTTRYRIERWRQSVRDAIVRRILDPAAAGVVAALVVGDQSAIQAADWEVFRLTGVAHLMAISGMHITGLAWLASVILQWAWRHSHRLWARWPTALRWAPQRLGPWVGCWVAFGYSVFSGWGVPAQRTVWMLVVVVLLRGVGRQWPWGRTWLVVCAVVLAWDPWAMLQAGFWLSFVAVGVLFASGDEPSQQAPHAASRFLQHGRRMWREQWRMSVGLAPLSLLLFQQVSVVGLLANLVAVPWVTLVVSPLSLFGLLHPGFWDAAAWAVQCLRPVLSVMANWPWASWSMPAVPLWVGVAGMLGLLTWVLPWPWWLRCLGVVWSLPLWTWQVPSPAVGRFELLAADIGQGNAVLVRTHDHALLYDTGPAYGGAGDAGQRVLTPLLNALGVRLDRLVISHQDNDHSGGASAVLSRQSPVSVLTSMPLDHPLRRQYAMDSCRAGQSWEWDGVRFAILHPGTEDDLHGRKSNALSCVLRIEDAQGVAALLVGDIEVAQEKRLLAQGQPLRAHWLLVPHHGSTSSSSEAFIQAVQPGVAMVQAGYLNRYGHPRAEVVARYEAQGVRVVQTVQCGAATWTSAQPSDVRCEREAQRRYWQHRIAFVASGGD